MLLLYRKSIYFFFLSISVIPTARSGEIAVESSLSSIEDSALGGLDNDNNTPSSSSFTTTTITSDVKVAQERFWRSQHQDQNHSTLSSVSTPFVSLNKAPLREHFPPEDFVVNAHIVSGVDGLSYFAPHAHDQGTAPPISIPFQECSSVGITTPPIPLRHFNIRHLPPAGTNPAWQNTGPQPQLVVCLHPLQITVSSGEVRTFKAGDVVLLEDMEGRGHKMSAPSMLEDGSTQQEEENLSVLILTLPPPPKHHSQKKPTFDKNKPCKLDSELPYYYSFLSDNPVSDDESGKNGMRNPNSFLKEAISRIDMQRLILTSVGVASSSALSYFLAKVAPPLLAVVFGGGCVVVGGTCMVVKGGETIMDQLEERKKKKRMEKVLKILEKEEKDQFSNMFATQHQQQEESNNVVGSNNNSSEVTSSTSSSSSSDGDTASKENNNDAVEFVASPHLDLTP